MSSSSYIDRTASAVEYCESMAMQNPTTATTYTQMASYIQDKLWHQLTRLILQVLSVSAVTSGDDSSTATMTSGTDSTLSVMAASDLYNKVVLVVDNKFHPLATARMAVLTSQHVYNHGNDNLAAKAVLENCLERLKNLQPPQQNAEATIYLQSKHALLALTELLAAIPIQAGGGIANGATMADLPPEAQSTLQQILSTIKTNAPVIQELSSTTSDSGSGKASGDDEQSIVHAAHYEMVMTYYKLVGPASAFYEHAMQYLQYAGPTGTISSTYSITSGGANVTSSSSHGIKLQFAIDLALAALTGTGIYNLTPITEQVAVLEPIQSNLEYVWLYDVLLAVAAGDIIRCRALSQQHATVISTVPALVQYGSIVEEKMTLTALVVAISHMNAHERNLLLSDVQQILHMSDMHPVELVLMRAFAIGLLRGSIDQVAGTVNISWVQPRRLTSAQMKELATKFGEWAVKVHQTAEHVQEQTSRTLLA